MRVRPIVADARQTAAALGKCRRELARQFEQRALRREQRLKRIRRLRGRLSPRESFSMAIIFPGTMIGVVFLDVPVVPEEIAVDGHHRNLVDRL